MLHKVALSQSVRTHKLHCRERSLTWNSQNNHVQHMCVMKLL